MHFSKETVNHIAQLAKLKFSEEESEHLADQFNEIISHVSKLAELNLDDTAPTNHVLTLTGALRPDVMQPSLPMDKVMQNAPQTDGQSFIVPKIL